MWKQISLIAASLTLAISLVGCGGCNTEKPERRPLWDGFAGRGSGQITTIRKDLPGVSRVKFDTVGDLEIAIGEREELRIEIDDNLADLVQTRVRGAELAIRTSEDIDLRPTVPPQYHLTVVSLRAITVASAGNIKVPEVRSETFFLTVNSAGAIEMGELAAGYVEAELRSSGDVSINCLRADDLVVRISSGGSMAIKSGKVRSQDVALTSTGSYHAQGLRCERAAVYASSGGCADIHVTDQLDANLTGSGNILYRGDPEIKLQRSGTGTVSPIAVEL
jgi:hypothetical protein